MSSSSHLLFLPFLHAAIHLPSYNPLPLRLPLSPSVLSPCFLSCFHHSGFQGAHVGKKYLLPVSLSFAYPSTLFLHTVPVPEVSDSSLLLLFSVPPVSIPPLTVLSPSSTPLLSFPLHSYAPMGAGGRG